MPEASAPPNILLLMADQLRADHVGFGGNDVVRTPALDALAARSMRFERACVANPICMPNRSTLFTGRLPSIHGVRFNGISLDPRAQTFSDVLRRRGYATAYFGKCHLQNMGMRGPGVPSLADAGRRVEAFDPPGPPGWDELENWDRHKRERVAMPKPYYGFDEVELAVNHSDEATGHYYQWLREQVEDPEALRGPERALPYAPKSGHVWRTALPEALYPTTWITDRTVAFLERHAKASPGRPFLAVCSYPDPHHPFTPPGRFFGLYDAEKLELPRTYGDTHADSPPHYRRLLAGRGKGWPRGVIPFSPTPEQLRECLAAEYGMISMIDEGVGRVLAALARTGLADDTVVVFTSDHGDMFGDHGVMLKGAMHYDGCLRVPLTIATPGRAAGVSTSLASTLDLAQTCLALAGAPEFQGMQGASLVPILDDPSARVRDHVLVEEDQIFDLVGAGRPLRMRTLVTEDARLTTYRGLEAGELFDRASDPDETRNLWARPEARARRVELERTLLQRLLDHADDAPAPTAFA